MHPKYPRLFTPIRLGPVELRNRFYMSPHAVPMTVGSKPSDDYVHYNVARVKGGCSLIVLSMALHSRARIFQPATHDARNVPAFRVLTDAIHAEGGKIFGEPYYQWATHGQWSPLTPPAPAFGPSPAQYRYHEKGFTTREMTREEIGFMLEAFRQTVTNMRASGFDGVMVHAAHGALPEQFLSPYFNRRADEYGGSLDNRMRFLRQSLEVARQAAGPDMAVGMRFNCDELITGGYHADEARTVLATIAREGLVDYVDLDVAVEPQQYHLGMPPVFMPPHLYRPYVEAVRDAVGSIPVLSVLGRMTSVADAEAMLEAGVCDVAGAARGLIAEPDLIRNAYEGLEDRSRTCIACNWCMAGVPDGYAGCAINPVAYRERIWGDDADEVLPRARRVVVVGGGPGGLEAARTSALRGHHVTLIEADTRLGGAFRLWSTLPGREAYHSAIDWWARELDRLGVTVQLNSRATAESVLEHRPDAVILATGAAYNRTGRGFHGEIDIPGHDRDFVFRPEEILTRPSLPAGRVVVFDEEGLHAGMGVAEMLAAAGADVDFVTPNSLPLSSRLMASQDGKPMMRRLREAGGRIRTMTLLGAIGDQEVTLVDANGGGEERIEEVDAVVLSTSRIARNDLEPGLAGRVEQLFVIGDALAPRMWGAATFEAHKFARLIGIDGAPHTVAEVYFGNEDPDLAPVASDSTRAADG